MKTLNPFASRPLWTCAATALLVTASITVGQSGSDLDLLVVAAGGDADEAASESIKSLDQVRQLDANAAVLSASVLSYDGTALRAQNDRRKTAIQKVNDLRTKLKPGEDRHKIESELRQALSEYFLADMRHRVRELDDIKARLAETEAKLQRRLDSQQESVDLQLKLFLAEADGLGFFSSEASLKRSADWPMFHSTQPVPRPTGVSPLKPTNPSPFVRR